MFRKALNKAMMYEGVYSNHPLDRGGETFRGISRKNWSSWDGWVLVDDIKKENNPSMYEDVLSKNFKLTLLTEEFYYDVFWCNTNLNLDEISDKFPNTAFHLFDVAVNMGVKTAAKFLQRGINILNRDEKNFENIKVDGVIGPKTLYILTEEIKLEKNYLPKLIVVLKAERYLSIIESDETQEVFIRGWLNRVSF